MSEGVAGGPGAADPGAVPPDQEAAWARAVRGRRRALVLTSLGVLGGYALFVVLLSLVQHAPPTWYAWVLLAVVLVLVAGSVWPLRSSGARAAWSGRTHRQIRIETALRNHVSIGEADRDEVTAEAESRRSLAASALVGYPLLALFVAFLLLNSGSIPGIGVLLGTIAVVLLCALALRRSRRRAAEARRWLAEPLPPEG
jgi:peptidoglycan/LPS O-acetylase OafA/YrhL